MNHKHYGKAFALLLLLTTPGIVVPAGEVTTVPGEGTWQATSSGVMLAQAQRPPALRGVPQPQLQERPLVTPAVPRYRDWVELWREVWTHSTELYDIRPATTVRESPFCPAKLGVEPLVEQTIRAVEGRRYGDAVQYLGRFQDRLQCVTPEGARGIELALSAFVHLALTELPPTQQRAVVHGAFNLGLLAFDQVQYTGRSWWLPAMHVHRAAVVQHLRTGYDGREMGLWLYHTPSATLVYHGFDAAQTGTEPLTGPMFAAFADPRRFGGGQCDLLAMVQASFNCTRGAAAGLGSGGEAGGGMGSPAGGGFTACAIGAAQSMGHQGTLTCLVRAAGPGGAMRHAPDAHAGPIVRGVLDERCALATGGTEAGRGGEDDDAPSFRERTRDAARRAGETFVQVVSNFFGGPLTGTGAPLLSESGAQAGEGLVEYTGELSRKGSLGETGDVGDYMEAREAARMRRGGGSQRHPGADGGCADGTNAAQRVSATYACTAGGGAPGGGPAGRLGDGRGPWTHPGPDSGTGAAGAGPGTLLSCGMQGGGLVRTGVADGRCRVQSCPPGSDTCACDGAPSGRGPGMMEAAAQRELQFFMHGGGLTDPPRDVHRVPSGPARRDLQAP